MANLQSSLKSIRSSERKRKRNQSALSELKTLWNQFTQLKESDGDKAKTIAQRLSSRWDRAVSHGVVPRGRADRKKTRIALRLNKFTGSKSK